MQALNLDRAVQRVTLVKTEPTGETRAVVLHKKPRKKKQSKLLKPLEKMARRLAKAQVAGMQVYYDRHQRSNSKKRNGWLRDYFKNCSKARKKASKVF